METASETKNLKPDALPLLRGVRVIASNGHGLLALDKPVGVMSHPNGPDDSKPSLLNARYDLGRECYSWEDADGVKQHAWLLNRLDSPTSGVILLSLDEALSTVIKQQFATHHVTKVYYALVKHAPTVPSGSWSDTLAKDVVRGKRLIKGGQRIPAKTRYQVAKTPTGGFPIALLKLMPLTGRTHQLRLQCQNHGHPIVGDRTYGSFSFNREVAAATGEKRMMLHSAATTVHYTLKGKAYTFHAESEVPEAFANVLGYRPGLHQSVPGPHRPAPRRASHGPLAGRRFRH